MNFDEIMKESFEVEADGLKMPKNRQTEILDSIEARGEVKRRGMQYKISKLFSKVNFIDVLGVAAFAAVLIAVPLVAAHFKNSSKMEAKIDNRPAVVKEDKKLHLSKDLTSGAGVVITITPRQKLEKSNITIAKEELEKLLDYAVSTEVKAVSINDFIVTEKSLFEDFRSKGYVLVDGHKISLEDKIVIKIIGNKDKLYKALTTPEIINRYSQWCEIKVEKLDSINMGISEPEKTVENYFKYMNEKNKEKLLENLTEWHKAPNVVWGFENLEYIKIIDIKEETDPTQKNGYLSNGRGKVNETKAENLKVYRVDYEVKYKKDGVGPQDSGKYTWWFFVIRKDANSPWFIDDYGV